MLLNGHFLVFVAFGWLARYRLRDMHLFGNAEMAKRKTANRSRGTSPTGPPKTKPAFASMFPGVPPHRQLAESYQLPQALVSSIQSLENELRVPVWLLVQDAVYDRTSRFEDDYNMIGHTTASAFFQARHSLLVPGQQIALVVDSGGGVASAAYEIAMLLRRHCGGFTAIVPRRAKSAATLLCLGADRILMNDNAELGPLDVQIFDPDREESLSGLDEVQSLERLQAFAMEAADRMMLMLLRRTNKKTKNLLPLVTDFVSKLTQPMFEGIDVVRYTRMSRLLKVAEEYGKRLLRRDYGEEKADEIASTLVSKFPEHGFAIYPPEAVEIGLRIALPEENVRGILEEMTQHLSNLNAIGNLVYGETES